MRLAHRGFPQARSFSYSSSKYTNKETTNTKAKESGKTVLRGSSGSVNENQMYR